mgnify:CR=1 FL=1
MYLHLILVWLTTILIIRFNNILMYLHLILVWLTTVYSNKEKEQVKEMLKNMGCEDEILK